MEMLVPDHAGVAAFTVMDGVRSDGASDSPTSSTGAPSRQRPKHPIPRNSVSGYERPERARTSHACEPCRDRKTKCDGDRPSCRRCLHTGTGCRYGYGKGWKKRKTAEDLTVTSSKLARYETLLNQIFPLVSPAIQDLIDDAREQEFGPSGPYGLPDPNAPAPYNAFDVDTASNSFPMQRVSLPPPPSLIHNQPSTFAAAVRTLPAPSTSDSSGSPLRPTPSTDSTSNFSMDDQSGAPAVRLPSITRHGILVEEGLRSPSVPGLSPPLGDASRLDERNVTLVGGEKLQMRPSNTLPAD